MHPSPTYYASVVVELEDVPLDSTLAGVLRQSGVLPLLLAVLVPPLFLVLMRLALSQRINTKTSDFLSPRYSLAPNLYESSGILQRLCVVWKRALEDRYLIVSSRFMRRSSDVRPQGSLRKVLRDFDLRAPLPTIPKKQIMPQTPEDLEAYKEEVIHTYLPRPKPGYAIWRVQFADGEGVKKLFHFTQRGFQN
ncbi:hypothetical protein EV702DRAFT_1048348 [Suillus placidus]|uniref:Uncharacterized protein n=1 Tax=Suillus placidus TaxID=48579 RepID=A0A9P6ZN40_9AGAM|nr:hypothetical protein EV702DRAFT_1048348 [Suillus placidus]